MFVAGIEIFFGFVAGALLLWFFLVVAAILISLARHAMAAALAALPKVFKFAIHCTLVYGTATLILFGMCQVIWGAKGDYIAAMIAGLLWVPYIFSWWLLRQWVIKPWISKRDLAQQFPPHFPSKP